MSPTVHASAVLVGARAVLIRGPSGSGKSKLAGELIASAHHNGPGPGFGRLVGDDRVHLQAAHGRLLVRPAETLAGLLEVRGVGVRRVAHEPAAVVGLVVDLGATDAERLPQAEQQRCEIEGVILPRLAVAAGAAALPAVLALLTSGQPPAHFPAGAIRS